MVAADSKGNLSGRDSFRDGCEAIRSGSTVVARDYVSQAHAVIRSDPRQAEMLARLARRVARRDGDESGELDALRSIAQARILQGRLDGALAMLDLALGRPAAADDLSGARVDALRVQPLVHLERYDDAVQAGTRAAAVFENRGDRRVDDRVHRNFAESGDPVSAHRAAMRETRERSTRPCFWAPFFLTGGSTAGAVGPDTLQSNAAREEHPRHATHGSAKT